MTVYGYIDGTYVELGKAKTRLGAWLITRKHRRMQFAFTVATTETPWGKVIREGEWK